MNVVIQLSLLTVLIAFLFAILPLLIQLRRTVKGMDALLVESRKQHPLFADVIGATLQARGESSRERPRLPRR